MATAAEVEAAAKRAEAAGDTAAAARLRARLPSQAGKVTKEEVRAAAERATQAGDTAAATRLLARIGEAPPAPASGGMPAGYIDEAQIIGGNTRAPTPPRPDTWTDTAGAMMQGPMRAFDAFAGGLTGGDSPSRDYLANDPLTGGLPGPVLTAAGALGDLGGAALAGIGAGVSGLIGLGTELVPGQDAGDERRLGNDLLGMAMFGVPELAGVSSVPARVAGRAGRVADAAPELPIAGDVAAAERLGIPVMRTDVAPPRTFIGKVAQKTGESIPVAGTAGPRAAQNQRRIEAAQALVREYGADVPESAIDDVAASVLAKRERELSIATGEKRVIIDRVAKAGPVPVPRAVAAIDAQIAKLRGQNMASLEPVIARLEDFKRGLQEQPFDVLEENRKIVGQAFAAPELSSVRDVGEKALSAIYGPLREDMGAFIADKASPATRAQWESANGRLSAMAGELKDAAFRRVLSKGEATPEEVGKMLFSVKPSDIARLYKALTPEGQARARTAILQRAFGKSTFGGDMESLSPDKLKGELNRLGPQISTFFKGDDLEAVMGLQRALKLTERAAVAGAAPLTGVQNVPAVVGTLVGTFTGSLPATVGALGTIGALARVYEATGVRRALRGLAKAQTPKAESAALGALDTALRDAGVPVGTASTQGAANSTSNPYEALFKRYGGPQ